MASTRFVQITGASLGGTAIDGVKELSFDEVRGVAEGRSDGAMGFESVDVVRSDVTGRLVVDDYDSMADVMTGSNLTPTYFTGTGKVDGGTSYDIHIGKTGENNGIVFTGFDFTIGSEPGGVAQMSLDFEAVYSVDNVKFLGTSAEYGATPGTALATIEAT